MRPHVISCTVIFEPQLIRPPLLQSPVASPKLDRPSAPAATEEGPGAHWKSKRRLIATRRVSLVLVWNLMLKAECSRLPLQLRSVLLWRPSKAPSFFKVGRGFFPLRPLIGRSTYFLMFKEVKYEAMRSFMSPTSSHNQQLGSFQLNWVLGTLPRGGATSPPFPHKVCRLTEGTPSTLTGVRQRGRDLLPPVRELWAHLCSSTI